MPGTEEREIALIMEISIRKTLTNRKIRTIPTPTIAELEKMLNCDTHADVNLLPDGSLQVFERTYASDLVASIVADLKANEYEITKREESTP